MMAKVLLIEDDEQNRYLATFLLEQSGFVVVHAANGPAGIERIRIEHFDLVLLDMKLPGLNGLAVARAIRSEQISPGVSIVAVTSYAMVGDREQALAAGCDGYLEKPIDPERFVAEISRYLHDSEEGPS